MSWKRLKRTTLVNTKFLNVYTDKVELPDGKIIDDYTVVEKPDYIIVIATDELGNLIALREYKYAINKTFQQVKQSFLNFLNKKIFNFEKSKWYLEIPQPV